MSRVRIAFWIALAAQLVIGFFYLASGLLVPLPPLLLMWAWWFVLSTLLIIKRDALPVVVTVPLVAAGSWFLILWIGETPLGWTA